MRVRHDRLWPMLRDIRHYALDHRLKIVSADSSLERCFGFETDCSEFRPEYRRWTIPISKVSLTAKKFDCFLDGERVQHPEQEEIMWRYLKLLQNPETRCRIADALTTGRHPEKPPVQAEQLMLRAVG